VDERAARASPRRASIASRIAAADTVSAFLLESRAAVFSIIGIPSSRAISPIRLGGGLSTAMTGAF
jgi:hypothetical protein